MMATTHILVGMLIGAIVSVFTPVSAPLAIVIGSVGGAFPDLDMPFNHRRTLHFPVYGSIFAAIALFGVLFLPSVWTAVVFIGVAAFAVHSVMDMFGGGLGLRPWLDNDDRAVYDHFRDKWVRTRPEGLDYDGSPKDLVLAIALSVVLAVTFPISTVFLWSLGLIVIVSILYTALRKPIVDFGVWLVQNLPERLARFIPIDEEEMNRENAHE